MRDENRSLRKAPIDRLRKELVFLRGAALPEESGSREEPPESGTSRAIGAGFPDREAVDLYEAVTEAIKKGAPAS